MRYETGMKWSGRQAHGNQAGTTMRGMKRVHIMGFLIMALFLVWCVLQTPDARAVSLECNNETLDKDVEIADNVNVAQGAYCNLDGAQVPGDVMADGASNVEIKDDTHIGGSVKIKNSNGERISITNSVITGDVQLDANTTTTIIIAMNIIGGDVVIKDTHCVRIDITDNQIGDETVSEGSLKLFNNRTDGLTVSNNHVAAMIKTKANDPPPEGGGNTAGEGCKGESCGALLATCPCEDALGHSYQTSYIEWHNMLPQSHRIDCITALGNLVSSILVDAFDVDRNLFFGSWGSGVGYIGDDLYRCTVDAVVDGVHFDVHDVLQLDVNQASACHASMEALAQLIPECQ
jgi:hypothetical protein